MNLFIKLCDPVYFKRTFAKVSVVTGILGLCLFTTVGLWLANNHEGKPGVFGVMAFMSITCIATGVRNLKK